MKNARPKKRLTRHQHIVPSWYLNNFCDSSGRLYVYERGKDVRSSIPRNECAERDFYEFDLAGRKTNQDWLGRIESDAKSILPEFIGSQQIKPSEATVWSYFLASLFWRTRKVRSQISSLMVSKLRAETQTDKFLREVQYAAFKKGELIFKDELRERIDSFQKKFEETPYYHVSGLPQHTHVLAETIARKNWHTISAPSGKYFATSDCPVVTVERKERTWELGAGFDKDNVIVFLPLTERKLFVAASASFGFKSTVPDVAADSFNLSTVRFAHRNVYAHQNSDDLKTLVDLEINKIEFGENAFT